VYPPSDDRVLEIERKRKGVQNAVHQLAEYPIRGKREEEGKGGRGWPDSDQPPSPDLTEPKAGGKKWGKLRSLPIEIDVDENRDGTNSKILPCEHESEEKKKDEGECSPSIAPGREEKKGGGKKKAGEEGCRGLSRLCRWGKRSPDQLSQQWALACPKRKDPFRIARWTFLPPCGREGKNGLSFSSRSVERSKRGRREKKGKKGGGRALSIYTPGAKGGKRK